MMLPQTRAFLLRNLTGDETSVQVPLRKKQKTVEKATTKREVQAYEVSALDVRKALAKTIATPWPFLKLYGKRWKGGLNTGTSTDSTLSLSTSPASDGSKTPTTTTTSPATPKTDLENEEEVQELRNGDCVFVVEPGTTEDETDLEDGAHHKRDNVDLELSYAVLDVDAAEIKAKIEEIREECFAKDGWWCVSSLMGDEEACVIMAESGLLFQEGISFFDPWGARRRHINQGSLVLFYSIFNGDASASSFAKNQLAQSIAGAKMPLPRFSITRALPADLRGMLTLKSWNGNQAINVGTSTFTAAVAAKKWDILRLLLLRSDREVQGLTDRYLCGYLSSPRDDAFTVPEVRPFLLDFVEDKSGASLDLCELIFKEYPAVAKDVRVLLDPILIRSLMFHAWKCSCEQDDRNYQRWVRMIEKTVSSARMARIAYEPALASSGVESSISMCLAERVMQCGLSSSSSDNLQNEAEGDSSSEKFNGAAYWLNVLQAVKDSLPTSAQITCYSATGSGGPKTPVSGHLSQHLGITVLFFLKEWSTLYCKADADLGKGRPADVSCSSGTSPRTAEFWISAVKRLHTETAPRFTDIETLSHSYFSMRVVDVVPPE
ncbi:unnamed protein product [Amoebophrya sp. A25]|nr:unnamed protein product [Amoebophrya sp. A25]|eukprot:GSA25T00022743001.1